MDPYCSLAERSRNGAAFAWLLGVKPKHGECKLTVDHSERPRTGSAAA
jgi:hypothetical protein